jgi:hypothetical protein
MDKTQTNNKGQTDASQGKVDPPHSKTEEFFSYGDHLKHIHEHNEEYWKGHNNTTEQKKK